MESNNHLLGSFALFIVLMLIASTMLFIALLLWLAHLVGSLIWALIIVGCGAGIVATLIYVCIVRPEMRQLREELKAIYEVANIVRSVYGWVRNLLQL